MFRERETDGKNIWRGVHSIGKSVANKNVKINDDGTIWFSALSALSIIKEWHTKSGAGIICDEKICHLIHFQHWNMIIWMSVTFLTLMQANHKMLWDVFVHNYACISDRLHWWMRLDQRGYTTHSIEKTRDISTLHSPFPFARWYYTYTHVFTFSKREIDFKVVCLFGSFEWHEKGRRPRPLLLSVYFPV